jgi:hypothetical protein
MPVASGEFSPNVDKLRAEGQVVAKSVSQELDLSEDTIRRDLRELAQEGWGSIPLGRRPDARSVTPGATKRLPAPPTTMSRGPLASSIALTRRSIRPMA